MKKPIISRKERRSGKDRRKSEDRDLRTENAQ